MKIRNRDENMETFFSIGGRINRLRYLKRMVAILLFYFSILCVFALGASWVIELVVLVALLGVMIASALQIVKRLHDLDKPGTHFWALLVLPVYNIYLWFLLLLKRGTAGANRFGNDPLGEEEPYNLGGLLTYVPFNGWVIAIAFLLVGPYKRNNFLRFHAFQSIFFNAVSLVVLGVVPLGAAWWVGIPLPDALFRIWGLVYLAILWCSIFLMYKAYNNEQFMLPVIGPLAAKQAG